MQAIAAAAGGGIVKGNLQVVVAEEPVECGPGFFPPAALPCCAIGLEISRDRCAGFDGLLVEAGFFGFLRVEAVRADGDEMALGFTALNRGEPIERFESGSKASPSSASSSC